MTGNEQQLDRLWQLIYNGFEASEGDSYRTLFASKGGRNDMQFAIMKKLGTYKQNHKHALLNEIEGDVRTAQAAGWLPIDIAEQSLTIISKLKEEQWQRK